MFLSASEGEQRLIDETTSGESLATFLAPSYQRNCLASISQLPPEILFLIFSFVKLYYRVNSLAWIQITHVSRYWRSVAIDSPTLWDDPPLESAKWMVEMLKRSKTVGLTISADLSTHPSRRKIAGLTVILRDHVARIQHLALTNMNYNCQEVRQNLPVSAPRLETLRLSSLSGPTNLDYVCVPKTALNSAENLRQLELSGCNVHWRCFPLSNITHLKLCDIACTARPTWTQFIDALAKMSKLESLDIESVLDPTVRLPAGTTSSPVHLSRLQSLTVESPTTEVEMLFEHVAFPPSAIIHVKAISSSDPISAVISNIARLYSGQEFLTLSIREMGASDPSYLTFVAFKLFRKVFERPNDIYMDTPVAELTLEFVKSRRFHRTADQIVTEIFNNGLPLDKVSHVEFDADITIDNMASTLGSLPELSFVRIGVRGGVSFVNVLYPMDAEYHPISFENLVSITLSVTFHSTLAVRVSHSWRHSWNHVSLKYLQACLIQRYECGAEIRKLSLDYCCHIKESDVRELKNIVVDVDWDGREEDEEESANDWYGTDEDSDYDPQLSFVGNILRADGSLNYSNTPLLSWS
ncbi:hypothetical protein HYPSUDRAFT_45620 [Hypholoma sublateritium FD-334 SS-4]|uniref:F-box domain-containing protein n=1 Tax=Hypholoma sublateritium (strain FD-334 SS-4) TaxID=945553 RepID=A0A0D2KTT0_HYPSF|nr:hypothetical protein HYPSUDRAFT_45620 [Hypholoma sublateritium FD-334 SS-4]